MFFKAIFYLLKVMPRYASYRIGLILTISIIWISDVTDRIKWNFFLAMTVSILCFGSLHIDVNESHDKKLNSNYTTMLCVILNEFWKQHHTKHQIYGHLSLISQTIHSMLPQKIFSYDYYFWVKIRSFKRPYIYIYIYIYIYNLFIYISINLTGSWMNGILFY